MSKSDNPPEWLNRTKKTAEESEHDKEVWERTQRRAFIGWVNHHLKKRKMEVEDPEQDFAGILKKNIKYYIFIDS